MYVYIYIFKYLYIYTCAHMNTHACMSIIICCSVTCDPFAPGTLCTHPVLRAQVPAPSAKPLNPKPQILNPNPKLQALDLGLRAMAVRWGESRWRPNPKP